MTRQEQEDLIATYTIQNEEMRRSKSRKASSVNGDYKVIEDIFSARVWAEYDSAAEWCARRGLKGSYGDPLPSFISSECYYEINKDQEAFAKRVNDCAYAIAMEKHTEDKDFYL